VLVTKLGRLVKENRIHSIEEIYLHSLPVKEHQIVDQLVPGLKDEVMKITHAEADPRRPAHALQGLHRRRRQQRPRRARSQVRQGGGHGHPRRHRPRRALRLSGAPAVYAPPSSPTPCFFLLRRGANASEGRASWKDTGGERTRTEGRPDSLSLLSAVECGDCWKCYRSAPPR
jgi:hypothetical protein